jgi:NAD(P)-dependent dehydrogenase (short-subunit alcohol dehydrogenase family)
VLVTGTSPNGIGFETARVIAKHANLVIITGYNLERYGIYFSITRAPNPRNINAEPAVCTRLKLSEDAIKREVPTANIRPLVLDLSSLAAVRTTAAEINAYPEVLHVRASSSFFYFCFIFGLHIDID